MIWTLLAWFLIFLINIVVLGLVPERRRPGSAMAWLLFIFLVPVVGLLFFLLIGSTHVPRKRREEQRVVGELIQSGVAAKAPPLAPSADRPAWLDTAMVLNRRLGWLPGMSNNSAELFHVYEESIQAKADLVRTAQRFVHVEYFMMCRDSTTEQFFQALLEVAARGVKVRVLFDHLSTYGLPGHKELLAAFDQAGIEWRPMLPIRPLKGEFRRPDLRNHRKIIVVDGRSAFVGSQNMIDSSYHKKKLEAAGRQWRELTTRVEGPVVQTINLVFAADWYIESKEQLVDFVQPEEFPEGFGNLTCQIVPSGPGFPDENNLRLFNTLIYGAQKRLSITSPYFVPDDSLLYAITTAAQRGVAVELFVSAQGEQFMVSHAQCSYYRYLLEAGVRIFMYPYPYVLHSKHFSIDDHTAVIGSSNMDIRSFNLDFEVSMMCTGPSFVTQMREVEDMYRTLSREMTLEEWKKRPLSQRWLDNVMRLTSAVQNFGARACQALDPTAGIAVCRPRWNPRTLHSMGYVLELGSAELLAEVGGKARNLGILIRAGFPVPSGFCVTTTGYRNAVGSRLADLIAELDAAADDQTLQHRLAAGARELVATVPVPAELADEVTAAYAGLGGDVPVAVRSSATAEDLEGASFAGQQDTYLNVVGADGLLDAVRRCWASLWTDRAVSYRASNGIEPAGVALAVVVQVMVDAVAAGVMFTADPVAGTRRRAVIDAGPGLGEAVVSGAVNPDHLVVDSTTGRMLDRKLGDKRLAIRAVPGGGTIVEELSDGSAAGCLTDAQAAELARLGDAVERHYGAPQDTEWALDGAGTVWLTQARPITTLYPQLQRPDRDGTRLFFCISLAQGLTRPFTPMGLATIRLIGTSITRVTLRDGPTDPLAGPTAFQEAGQRPFVDATAAFRHPMARRLMFGALGVMEARAAAVLRTLDDDPRFAVEPTGRLGLLHGVAKVLVRTRAPLNAAIAVVSPDRAVRRIDQAEVALRRRLTVPATATPEQRLDRIEHALSVDTFMLMPSNVAYAVPGFVAQALARRLLGERATNEERQTVLRGLPNNVTTVMDLALWDLTEQVRADPPSAAAFRASVPELAWAYAAGTLPLVAQVGMAGFLRRYGHRAVAEIDLGMPRWSDDPSHLLGAVRNYLSLDDPALAPSAQFAAGTASAEAMIAELVCRIGGPGSPRGRLVGFALDRARRLTGLRESPKFLLIVMFGLIRAELQRVGAALQRRGAIDDADDIFFVDLAQARAGLAGNDLRPTVHANKGSYGAELNRRHIPRILLSDGTEPEATARPADAPEGALLGSPASAGTVTARARVILDPVGARLDPGEILVAPSTDPGWTPLFLTAGGLVMEMGGSNSHGAVVAREYGIPAVVGVPDATRRIRTGDLVTVDGAAGLVTQTAHRPDESR